MGGNSSAGPLRRTSNPIAANKDGLGGIWELFAFSPLLRPSSCDLRVRKSTHQSSRTALPGAIFELPSYARAVWRQTARAYEGAQMTQNRVKMPARSGARPHGHMRATQLIAPGRAVLLDWCVDTRTRRIQRFGSGVRPQFPPYQAAIRR